MMTIDDCLFGRGERLDVGLIVFVLFRFLCEERTFEIFTFAFSPTLCVIQLIYLERSLYGRYFF